MDRNTILAIVLSAIVIFTGMFINAVFFPAPLPEAVVAEEPSVAVEESAVEPSETTAVVEIEDPAEEIVLIDEEQFPVMDVVLENNLFRATVNTQGAELSSFILKEYEDNGSDLDMIFKSGLEENAFSIKFGDYKTESVDKAFKYTAIDTYTHEFAATFVYFDQENNAVPFLLKKIYQLYPNDYMFELKIVIENSIRDYPNLIEDGFAYTLSFGPQIGPEFDSLGGRGEKREYFKLFDEKRNRINLRNEFAELSERVTWIALKGKYFSLAVIPDDTSYSYFMTSALNTEEGTVSQENNLHISRPLIKSAAVEDTFKVYLGPNRLEDLESYNNSSENDLKLSGLQLDKLARDNSWFGWLQGILKFFLDLFYFLIPNYGVSIILLTILVKVLLFPLTHKSYESTSKMQSLGPKINDIKEKYKNNQQKMNQEMAALYQQEGVNPLSGCLPILFQAPIFIALFGLLNNHFELRGAVFIPGWITDLSLPESIWNFAPFTVPFVGWSDLRLLPIMFVITQILYSQMMQQPTGNEQQQTQAKMMKYLLPGMFFFILYNSPSGLLLYWTVSNLLTAVQQIGVNWLKKSKAQEA
jgi:YidC/Oxa1 family membrane protein insertase